MEQFDELTLKIADRLGQIFSTSSQFDFDGLEIEAKFGIFKKKDQSRLEYSELEPGYIPLAFLPNPPYQFITEVPPKMFTHLRDVVLNGRVNNFNQFKYEPEIKFVKTHTIDETYILPDGQTKVRVTKDAETGDIIACITKQDLSGPNGSNINILNNGRDIDCRISARREVSVPVPESNSIFSKREKKRSSYHVGMWSIDMTEIPFTNSTTTTTTSSKQVDLAIPYVSEVHHCNNPVNDQIVFKHKNNNLHIELLELALDSKKVSFSFPQNTYRFEGQFADCFMERKSTGKSWEFVTQLAGVGENGSSYGSLRSLQFALPGDLQLYSGLSYRFKCPNGVSNVRHRYFIPPTELLTVSVTPLDYDRLDDHHHHFQTTIQFTPRENTNIVLIMFIVIASISLAAVLIAVLYFCGFFGYIYRLVTPTVDYSLQNSGSKIKWVQHE